MNVLDRIKELLQERNWSLYKLSKSSGIPQSTLSNLFNRNNSPSISTLEDICKGFDISLSQFFAQGDESVELTTEQKDMLIQWNGLTIEQKEALVNLMKNM